MPHEAVVLSQCLCLFKHHKETEPDPETPSRLSVRDLANMKDIVESMVVRYVLIAPAVITEPASANPAP